MLESKWLISNATPNNLNCSPTPSIQLSGRPADPSGIHQIKQSSATGSGSWQLALQIRDRQWTNFVMFQARESECHLTFSYLVRLLLAPCSLLPSPFSGCGCWIGIVTAGNAYVNRNLCCLQQAPNWVKAHQIYVHSQHVNMCSSAHRQQPPPPFLWCGHEKPL